MRCADSRPRRVVATLTPISRSTNKMSRSAMKRAFHESVRNNLFYLTSRGLTEAEASTMIVNRFIEPLDQRAADGIRRRNESTDRTADGRFRRVSLLFDARFPLVANTPVAVPTYSAKSPLPDLTVSVGKSTFLQDNDDSKYISADSWAPQPATSGFDARKFRGVPRRARRA